MLKRARVFGVPLHGLLQAYVDSVLVFSSQGLLLRVLPCSYSPNP
jgi:hypothetical protein